MNRQRLSIDICKLFPNKQNTTRLIYKGQAKRLNHKDNLTAKTIGSFFGSGSQLPEQPGASASLMAERRSSEELGAQDNQGLRAAQRDSGRGCSGRGGEGQAAGGTAWS